MIIQTVKWSAYQTQLKHIRHIVFIQEQGIEDKDEWDEYDSTADHIIVSLPHPLGETHIIGCARLVHDNDGTTQIGRVAVLPQYRGKGIASAMVKHGVITAMQHHFAKTPTIYLNAQNHLIDFYRSFAFLTEGETFLDANILHTKMVFDNKNTAIAPYFSHQSLEIISAQSFACLATLMAKNSIRKIQILSDNLSQTLYNTPVLADTFSTFLRKHRHAHIDIAVANTRQLGKGRHALVELAQRMPSKLRIQKIKQSLMDTQAVTRNQDTLTFDKAGFIALTDSQNSQGFGVFDDQVKVKQAQTHFDYVWQGHCERDPNLSKLTL